jgi:hypothetical protein
VEAEACGLRAAPVGFSVWKKNAMELDDRTLSLQFIRAPVIPLFFILLKVYT